jgi:hypothetical protein
MRDFVSELRGEGLLTCVSTLRAAYKMFSRKDKSRAKDRNRFKLLRVVQTRTYWCILCVYDEALVALCGLTAHYRLSYAAAYRFQPSDAMALLQ